MCRCVCVCVCVCGSYSTWQGTGKSRKLGFSSWLRLAELDHASDLAFVASDRSPVKRGVGQEQWIPNLLLIYLPWNLFFKQELTRPFYPTFPPPLPLQYLKTKLRKTDGVGGGSMVPCSPTSDLQSERGLHGTPNFCSAVCKPLQAPVQL